MSLLRSMFPWIGAKDAPRPPPAASPDTMLPGEPPGISSERGHRTTPENLIKYLHRIMWVDPDVRQAILDVREMDRADGRVKRIHGRVARDIVRGGLTLQQSTDSPVVSKHWDQFVRRLELQRASKLKSDARGLVMEGNLPLQVILDETFAVVGAVRMASETILPDVSAAGRFKDVRRAYVQLDVLTGGVLATFPLWQLHLTRFDPDNFDDLGAMGRPFLDAARTTWRKLVMTEEDLVIRRRMRAPLRLSHVLEGASKEDLESYEAKVTGERSQITTDYYSNRKGSVTAVQGDSNLDQIADVVHLLDTFFSGSPLPKGLAGYTEGLARDILEDLKRDYYDEIDLMQEDLAFAYEHLFRLHLLLQGVNPDSDDFCIRFAERRTETPTQTADRALKWRALGLPHGMVWEELGLDPSYVRERIEYEAANFDPYPDPDAIRAAGGAGGTGGAGGAGPRVSITPGNGRKGESGTAITHR